MRTVFPYLVGLAIAAAAVWAFSFSRLPPADFTFCNGTEVQTLDPALVTGQPEGRIVWALFEGLCTNDPKTLEPRPGVAERWEISPDGRTYTFHLRAEARWSDGQPVTAGDFVYSYRRFLHPATAAEYAKELWYIAGARQFNTLDVQPGDRVEVETLERPAAALPHAPGTIVRGRLRAIEEVGGQKLYTVEIGGRLRRLVAGPAIAGAERVRWVLYDFEQVGLRALDERTLRIELIHPVPYFLDLMAFYPFSPVNRRCVETHGFPGWTKPGHLVGNGAFRLHSRRIRDRIRLVKNPHYWDAGSVRLDVVDALAGESAGTMLNLYLTGAADWITEVPLHVIPDLRRRPAGDYDPTPYLSVEYYLINVRRPPLDDARVRQALSLALDRREIVERVLRAGQVPADSLVPREISRYIDYHPPRLAERDVARARQLLAEAGYPGGRGMRKLEILYNTRESHRSVAELMQSQWKEALGIDVGLANQEWGSYLDSRRMGKYDIARAGWIGDYIDPVTFLDLFTSQNPNNHTGYARAEYDRLLESAALQADRARRYALLHEAEAMLLDDLPMLPTHFAVTRNMVRPYVRGFHENLLDIHPLRDVWIDEPLRERILAGEGLR